MVNLFSLIQDYLVDQEDGIRQLITWFLNLVMEEEALVQSGAKWYERTNSRKASRNGYKPRTLKTKYGELELLKPQFREFPFETGVFEKYFRVEKAILAAVSESYPSRCFHPKGGRDYDCLRSRKNFSLFCFENY